MDDPVYPRELVEEAERHPGGWVYEIDESLVDGDAYSGAVPPEAIKGAWAVNADGRLTGEFTPNPNYRPKRRRGRREQ
jgi:hypothetical protein